LESHETSGIVIDVCGNCRGTWFDRGELEEYVRIRRQIAAPLQLSDSHSDVYSKTGDRSCPRCETTDLSVGSVSGYSFERCEKCGGLWFSYDRLEQVVAEARERTTRPPKGDSLEVLGAAEFGGQILEIVAAIFEGVSSA